MRMEHTSVPLAETEVSGGTSLLIAKGSSWRGKQDRWISSLTEILFPLHRQNASHQCKLIQPPRPPHPQTCLYLLPSLSLPCCVELSSAWAYPNPCAQVYSLPLLRNLQHGPVSSDFPLAPTIHHINMLNSSSYLCLLSTLALMLYLSFS